MRWFVILRQLQTRSLCTQISVMKEKEQLWCTFDVYIEENSICNLGGNLVGFHISVLKKVQRTKGLKSKIYLRTEYIMTSGGSKGGTLAHRGVDKL